MVDLQVTLNTDTTASLNEEAVNAFKAGIRGGVVTAEDANYDEVRQIWNGMHDKRPALIARCESVADVIDAVNFARENGLLVAVRGGGHNVAGSASCEGGIMIDLSPMNWSRVDLKTQTVRCGGGATWGDVDRATQAFGMAVPGGVVSTTGVGGLTLGGGLGRMRRKHGLSIDNLLSVDIVTADGQLLVASESENADLFWGVRGGGGNFGVVTSFEFKMHPVGPMVMFCAPWYPVDDPKPILAGWRDFMSTAPDEVSSEFVFWTVPPVPDFPEEIHMKRFMGPVAVYLGTPEEGEKVLQPLRELGPLLADLSHHAPWVGVQSAFDPFFPKGGRHYYFKSRYLRGLDDATINAIIPRATQPVSPFILNVIWHFGGAMSRVPAEATAFRGRNAGYLFSIDAVWDDPAETDDVIAFARKFLADMEPHSTGGLYVNFAGLGEEGEDLVRDAYGQHYPRLQALKTKYDPTNLFRLNQNIKPSH